MEHLLELRGLEIASHERTILRGVDLDVHAGKITAVMGPSGAGKSVTARACMGFLDVEPGIKAGSLRFPALGPKNWFEGVRSASDQARVVKKTATLRGSYVTYSPQAASSALNPARTVGRQIEIAVLRRASPASDVAAAIRQSLEEVGLPLTAANALPGQLSGGQCQRAALAIAVAPLPRVVIADEPETGLDPVLTRQILELMLTVCKHKGCGVLLISHHEETVDRVADSLVRIEPIR